MKVLEKKELPEVANYLWINYIAQQVDGEMFILDALGDTGSFAARLMALASLASARFHYIFLEPNFENFSCLELFLKTFIHLRQMQHKYKVYNISLEQFTAHSEGQKFKKDMDLILCQPESIEKKTDCIYQFLGDQGQLFTCNLKPGLGYVTLTRDDKLGGWSFYRWASPMLLEPLYEDQQWINDFKQTKWFTAMSSCEHMLKHINVYNLPKKDCVELSNPRRVNSKDSAKNEFFEITAKLLIEKNFSAAMNLFHNGLLYCSSNGNVSHSYYYLVGVNFLQSLLAKMLEMIYENPKISVLNLFDWIEKTIAIEKQFLLSLNRENLTERKKDLGYEIEQAEKLLLNLKTAFLNEKCILSKAIVPFLSIREWFTQVILTKSHYISINTLISMPFYALIYNRAPKAMSEVNQKIKPNHRWMLLITEKVDKENKIFSHGKKLNII